MTHFSAAKVDLVNIRKVFLPWRESAPIWHIKLILSLEMMFIKSSLHERFQVGLISMCLEVSTGFFILSIFRGSFHTSQRNMHSLICGLLVWDVEEILKSYIFYYFFIL